MIGWFLAKVKNKEQLAPPFDATIKLENCGGGYNYLLSKDVILEIVEGKNWDVMDSLEHRSKTSEYQYLKNFARGGVIPGGI